MSTLETKKRLLLSKWHERQKAHPDLVARVEHLETDVESLQDERNSLQSELDELEGPGMRDVLEQVKYWMHEPLVLQMPMRDPRVILRKVEDALS